MHGYICHGSVGWLLLTSINWLFNTGCLILVIVDETLSQRQDGRVHSRGVPSLDESQGATVDTLSKLGPKGIPFEPCSFGGSHLPLNFGFGAHFRSQAFSQFAHGDVNRMHAFIEVAHSCTISVTF